MALVCVSDYKQQAAKIVTKNAWEFYCGGADEEFTLELNETAYNRLRIRPRVLVDVSHCDTSCNVFGIKLDFPVAIAPVSMQKMANPEGELASARAAGKLRTIYTLSTVATSSIEDVADAAPDTNLFFQLYVFKDREVTKKLVKRAETAGYKALVLTVDSPVAGFRRNDVRNKFELPSHLKLANFGDEKVTVRSGGGSGIGEYVRTLFDKSVNWRDVEWLVNYTKMPVILKGILTHEDATLALKSGCKGIIVSNHGGRQLDGVPATIEALPEIVKAVGSQLTVMVDGGIRNGKNVFKALALGAKAVFVGRPVIYGLAVDGQRGVEDVLSILKNEFSTAMCLAGVTKVSDISANHVTHESNYLLSKI